MRELDVTRIIVLIGCVFGLLGLSISACSHAEQSVVRAADLVDAVAHKGDQIDAVSVELCHEAESAAAELPDLEEAENTVMEIRAGCDRVFGAIDKLEQAIKHVDLVFEAVERGDAKIEDLARAAVAARQAYEKAYAANEELRELLQEKGRR